jgi:hypothetical protein
VTPTEAAFAPAGGQTSRPGASSLSVIGTSRAREIAPTSGSPRPRPRRVLRAARRPAGHRDRPAQLLPGLLGDEVRTIAEWAEIGATDPALPTDPARADIVIVLVEPDGAPRWPERALTSDGWQFNAEGHRLIAGIVLAVDDLAD